MKKNETTLDVSQIKLLIEAFYEGETTIEQEQFLFHYFESQDIAKELLDDKELFLQMYHSEPAPVCPNLEVRLNAVIDRLSKEELKPEHLPDLSPDRRKISLWISSAACIAILVSTGLFFIHNQVSNKTTTALQNVELKDTFANPEDARIEAEKALVLVSTQFNKGMDQLAMVSENMKKTNDILDKTFNNK